MTTSVFVLIGWVTSSSNNEQTRSFVSLTIDSIVCRSLSGMSAFGMRQGWSILVYIGTLWAPSSVGPHSLPLFHIQGHRTQGQIHWGWCVKRSAPLRHAQLLHWHQWKCSAGCLHNTLNLGLLFKHFVWKVLQHNKFFVCYHCVAAVKWVGELMIMGAGMKHEVIIHLDY